MYNEQEFTPTASNLVVVLEEFVQGTRYRPGIVRQLMEPLAQVERETGVLPGHTILEALLNVVRNMQRNGASGAEILAASKTEFQSVGPDAAELMPYTQCVVWLQSEEDPERPFYNIGTDTAIPEIMTHATYEALELDGYWQD